MKKIALIILFCSVVFSFAQQKRDNNKLYIYVNNNDFWPAILGYKAVFAIKSKDKRFSHDNYFFKISYTTVDYQSLYSLGTLTDISDLDYVEKPSEYFSELSVCELHDKLSLYNEIFIITEIPKSKLDKQVDKSKTHIMWSARYDGTLKDFTWVNPTHKNFIDED